MAIADWRLQTEEWRGVRAAVCLALVFAACARAPKPRAQPVPPGTTLPAIASTAPAALPGAPAQPALVPWPALVEIKSGQPFTITPKTAILANADPAVRRIAADLAERIRRATGIPPDMPATWTDVFAGPVVELVLQSGLAALGDEGYDLSIGSQSHQIAYRRKAKMESRPVARRSLSFLASKQLHSWTARVAPSTPAVQTPQPPCR